MDPLLGVCVFLSIAKGENVFVEDMFRNSEALWSSWSWLDSVH